MTGYRWRGDVPMNATVEPYAAVAVLRVASDALELEVRRLAAAGRRAEFEQLLRAVRQMRKAGAQVDETSGRGSAEVPTGGDGSWSGGPPSSGLTTGAVAAELGVTSRQVTNLIGSGLRGHRVGGRWVIDVDSVAEELTRRRNR